MAATKGKGRVLWFNDSKGYGEILGDDGKKYFAHYVEIDSNRRHRTLKEGSKVQFDIDELPETFSYEGSAAVAQRIRTC